MAKKKKTSFEWAAQSAIQKGIRRGNLPLVKAAFEVLWRGDRSWLMWRTPILAVEEYWPSAASMPASVMDRGVDKETLLGFLLSLALCAKDRSAHGLVHSYSSWVDDCGHRGMQARWMRRVLELHAAGKADQAIGFFEKEAAGQAADVIKVAVYRFAGGKGGMAGDQRICLAAMVLAMTETGVCYDMPRTSGDIEDKEFTRWPWWCYDMHTKVGLAALEKAAERLEVDRDAISKSWLFGESLALDQEHGKAWWMSSMNTEVASSVPQAARWGMIRETVRQAVEMEIEAASAEDRSGMQAVLPGLE